MKRIQREIEQILGVYYVSPHVSQDGVAFDEPRCGDCWCTIQEVHTHSDNAEYVQPLVDLFQREFARAAEKIAL